MASWQDVRDQVKAAFQAQFAPVGAGQTVGVAWHDEQRPIGSQLLLLSVVSWQSLHDRVVLTRTGSTLERSISTLMQATIQVRAESIEAGGGDHSLEVSERARIGMQLGTFTAALTDVEVIGPDLVPDMGLRVNYPADGRQITATLFEFNVRFETMLADPTTYYPMTTAKVCGTADDVDTSVIQVICDNIPEEPNLALNDLHFSKFLTLDGAGVTHGAEVNGSVTAQYFELRPAAGVIWYVARLLTHTKCGGAAAWNEFGDVAALANGVTYKVVRGTGVSASVTQDITDDLHTISTNDDARMYQFDVDIVSNGSGPAADSVHSRLPFARFGAGLEGGIFLSGDTNDALRITIQDDLTSLTALHYIAQGQIYNTQQVPL